MEKPLVSVCTITYGHEKFIADTIKGVLMQKVNFPIEFIIADDCSTDGTEKIVKKLIEIHHNGYWIKYTKHSENKGMNSNFAWAFSQCKGKYIALCEGDDYWTDSKKLQKQVDYLEKNKDVNICFARANVLKNGQNDKFLMQKQFIENKFKFIELLKHKNFIVTATIVFRNNEKLVFPDWFNQSPMGDLPAYKFWVKQGFFYCLSDFTAVYRMHDGGMWSGMQKKQLATKYLKFYNLIYSDLDLDEKSVVRLQAKKAIYNIATESYLAKAGMVWLEYYRLRLINWKFNF